MSFIDYIGERKIEVDATIGLFNTVKIYSVRMDGKDIKDKLNDRAINRIERKAFDQQDLF